MLAAFEQVRGIPGTRFPVSDNHFSFFIPLADDDRTDVSADARKALRRFSAAESLQMELIVPEDATAASRAASTTPRASTLAKWSS